MKRIATLISAVVVLGGCVNEGAFRAATTNNDCEGKGYSKATISYGDSYLDVTPDTHTKRKGEIRFKLDPQKKPSNGIDYKELEITIEGKKPTDRWLDTKGKASENKKIFVCVKDTQNLGTYEYKVMVPGGNEIDPRVHVE
jgi:hypothetical protein